MKRWKENSVIALSPIYSGPQFLSGHAVLWLPADDGVVPEAGLCDQSHTRTAMNAPNRVGRDCARLMKTQHSFSSIF